MKNALWILCDQLRASALGYAGDPNVRTPHLDTLAATGLRFDRAVSGAPLCCPARGALLTSRYPHECVPAHEALMPPDQPTVAHAFREHGYDTFYLGKWHLDGYHESEGRSALHIIPRERRGGFDSFLGYDNNNSQYDCYIHGHRGDAEVPLTRLPRYETDALTDIMIDYLKDRAADHKPFFAVLSVQPPHDPYIAPPDFMRDHPAASVRFRPNVPDVAPIRDRAARELSGYYAMIENLDANVGRVVSALRESGLLDDTHIVFYSDHGDMHGSHGQFRKLTAYEEAIGVPLILSGEGSHYDGRRTDIETHVRANHVDIAPTTLGLCGLPVPQWMRGADLSGLRLAGRPAADRPRSAYLQSVVPTGHGDSIDKPWRGIATDDGWKLACFEGCAWMMVNLNEDPYEQVNMAHNPAFAAKRRELQEALRGWIERTGDAFQLPKA